MRVLVTGGTGFVGGWSAKAIADAGHSVRFLVRNPARLETSIAQLGVDTTDYAVGDITDRDSTMRALDGCDAVVHSAAAVVGAAFANLAVPTEDHTVIALRNGPGLPGDIAARGLKRIEAVLIRPSEDIGDLFREQLEHNPYLDPSFSTFERLIMRLLAIDPREGRELLWDREQNRALAQEFQTGRVRQQAYVYQTKG